MQQKHQKVKKFRIINIKVLFEMSQILNCGLERQQLSIIAGMIENGSCPESLVHHLIKE
ncbi:hypothetical protein pb186bvf_013831 [Paramecium bursaria]